MNVRARGRRRQLQHCPGKERGCKKFVQPLDFRRLYAILERCSAATRECQSAPDSRGDARNARDHDATQQTTQ